MSVIQSATTPWTLDSVDSYVTLYDNSTEINLPIPNVSRYAALFKVLYVVVPIFGLPGNFLSIIVLGSNREIRMKPVNMFMIHQSLIDFCACLVLLLTKMYNNIDIVSSHAAKVVLCRFWVTNVMYWGIAFVSGNNLVCLTMERFWATKNPLGYDASKVRRRLPIVFHMAWLSGILLMFPKFTTTRVIDGKCVAYREILLWCAGLFSISDSCFMLLVSFHFYRMAMLVVMLNSCLNPYIYSIRYKEYQTQFKTLFCKRSESSNKNEGVTDYQQHRW